MKEMVNTLKRIFVSGDIDKMIKALNNEEVHEIISFYLKHDKKLKTKSDILIIEYLLRIANYIYTNSGSSTGMSDSEYDQLMSLYQSKTGSILPIEEQSKKDKYSHKYPQLRGTLDKIYKITTQDVLKNETQKSLEYWVNTAQRHIGASGKHVDLWDQDVIVMPKFDGCSCIFECSQTGKVLRTLTRGDTKQNKASDITSIVGDLIDPPYGKDDDIKVPYGVKTELVITNEDLPLVNEMMGRDFKSTRSAVSAIINSDPSKSKVVKEVAKMIKPLQLRVELDGEDEMLAPGIFDFPTLKCKLKDIESIHEFAFENKNTYSSVFNGYVRCDGAVIYLLNKELRTILGRENDRNKYEVAFKFTEEISYSKVTGISTTVGASGKINIIVNFKPVTMKGNTVTKAYIGSLPLFEKFNIHKGDMIKIYYDIVPYAVIDDNDSQCVRNKKGKKIKLPDVCPDCGEVLEIKDTNLYCTNKNCPSRKKRQIENYVRKMNISYIGEQTINDFYENHIVRNIEDLYRLNDHRKAILSLNGYSDKRLDLMINDINNNKECNASLLFGSIGIPGCSITRFKQLFKYHDYHDILDVCLDKNMSKKDVEDYLSSTPGFKSSMISNLYKGINDNKDLIVYLLKTLHVKNDIYNDNVKYHVAFTKIRDKNLEMWITSHGGEVDPRFRKSTTDFIIVPDVHVHSETVNKANRYHKDIVALEDVKKYVSEKYDV